MSAYEEARRMSLFIVEAGDPLYPPAALKLIQAADKEIARIPDYKETVRLLRQERRQLDAELARLREVLDKIANPVLALQEEAQEFGAKIDAVEAIRMTQNPSWYRTTARKALKSRDS